MCMLCRSLFVLFLLDIVSFDLVLFMDSDCPFGIFKIFSPGFKWFFFIIHLLIFGMYIKLALMPWQPSSFSNQHKKIINCICVEEQIGNFQD